ncbi:hypothetical protein GCM10018965_004470 [Nonomuraea roseola]
MPPSPPLQARPRRGTHCVHTPANRDNRLTGAGSSLGEPHKGELYVITQEQIQTVIGQTVYDRDGPR